MRCKCCDSIDTRLWLEDYYCEKCRKSITQTLKENSDDDTSYPSWIEETPMLHSSWDDEDE